MLPEDDRMIESRRSFLSVSSYVLLKTTYVHLLVCVIKYGIFFK